jgi:zinc/manganese transport system permease protein
VSVFLLPAITVVAVTAIAVACGLVGWFAVLRAQVFAVDAMSHFAFTGAVVAVALAADPRTGLFGFTIACALLLAALGGRARVDDVTVGVAITWILGIGVLALAVIARSGRGGAGATAAVALFGNISGIDSGQARLAAVIAIAVVAVVVAAARPLLFASLDPGVARTLGVPAAVLGAGFLLALAGVAAEATQAVGALLLIGLVSAPAGAAHRLTARPYRGMMLAVAIAVASVWIGLVISARIPAVAPSSAIVGVAAACFAVASAPGRLRMARRRSG